MMKLAAASITVLVASMALFDLSIVRWVMIVPFVVNIYLMLRVFRLWKHAGYGDIYRSEQYKAAFIHLILWVLLSAAYFIFVA
ncbi:hypothetical protein [Sphingorhabdus sp. 109]|jgi:hypothetical protein|uniref:hypothetical protein n=1 Tax=Sphingorhabdus sp. 109 TaxID=2653173 RepID=UPI0012F09105|nr:hypothetical protein [Sphingorhabdus sp. 109]VWX56828.1 hypothetical protein SPHINGOR109_10681 [Sphingorhabdus sp. 109]